MRNFHKFTIIVQNLFLHNFQELQKHNIPKIHFNMKRNNFNLSHLKIAPSTFTNPPKMQYHVDKFQPFTTYKFTILTTQNTFQSETKQSPIHPDFLQHLTVKSPSKFPCNKPHRTRLKCNAFSIFFGERLYPFTTPLLNA